MSNGQAVDDFTTGSTRALNLHQVAAGVAAAISSPVLALAGIVGLFDDVTDALALLACAGACVGGAGVVWNRVGRLTELTQRLRPAQTLSAGVFTLIVLAGISTVAYVITGVFSNPVDALYESVAGVGTSSLTVLTDPAELSDALLIWRSGTQWLGGLAALMLAVGLLPFVGGSRELADPGDRRTMTRPLAPRPVKALKHVVVIYSTVSAAVLATLLVVGLGVVDAIAYTFSSVSTGGFSTAAGPVSSLHNVAAEVVLIIVMAGAASSLAVVWLIWSRQFAEARRLFEFKVFALVLPVASLIIWWRRPPSADGALRELLDSAFTVVSLASTTGFWGDDWGSWKSGLSTALFMLMIIGGMAGSVSGGLRWMRVLTLTQFMWRELQRQLHPNSIRSVKVGEAAISDASVDRMHAHLIYLIVCTGAGAFLLSFCGLDIVESLSLAASALSTAGPGLGDGTTIAHAGDLEPAARVVLMPLMIAGRAFLYPAFAMLGLLWFTAERRLSATGRLPSMRRRR